MKPSNKRSSASIIYVSLFAALLFFAALPCAAQHISEAAAADALAEVLRSRGLRPLPESGLTLKDYIWTDVTTFENVGKVDGVPQDARWLSVDLSIGSKGYILPKPEWLTNHPNYCKNRARYMRSAVNTLYFKLTRITEEVKGVVRNQIFAFGRLTDVATGATIKASDAGTSNKSDIQSKSEGDISDAIRKAWNKLNLNVGPLVGPCGEVRVRHLSGLLVGEPLVFLPDGKATASHLITPGISE